MTLGTGGRGPQARSVPQGPAVWLWRRRHFDPPTPAASRGSASEEALLATRGEKRKLDKHGLRPATGFLDPS